MKIVNDINQLNQISLNFDNNTKNVDKNKTSPFDDIYKAALNIFNETNDLQKQADAAQLDFITGKNDNMLTPILAQRKAYTSLNFTVQVTNKAIEAYREIMRIQL